MTTKSDWQAVHEQMMAEERRKLGEPPTFEEVLAYSQGELSPAEEERVRALLVCYPDLARAVMEPLAEDVDADRALVSDEELARHRAALETRIAGVRGGAIVPFRSWWVAVAAAVAVVVMAGLYWQRLHSNLPADPTPRALELQPLPPGESRGGEAPTQLSIHGESVVLPIPVPSSSTYEQYRLELVDSRKRTLWYQVRERPASDAFALTIPRSFLAPGTYEVVLYGMDGGRRERVVGYPFTIPTR